MAGVRIPVLFDGDTTQLQGQLDSFAGSLTRAGAGLSAALTAPLVGLGTLAGKEFAGFERSLTNIELLAGVAGSEVQALAPDIRRIGTTAGISGTEAADAFFFLQSGLGDSAQAMDALDAATKASAIGLGSVEDVSSALVSVFAAYGNEVGSASDVMEIFGSAAQASTLSADQMASGLQGAIPQAGLLGISLDDLAATMAVISPAFASGAEAGTGLSAAMRAMSAPTEQAKKLLEEAGTSSEELQKIVGEQGLSGAMQFLGETFDGDVEALNRVLGRSEAARATMAFLSADADTVSTAFGNVADRSFDLDESFERLGEDSGFRVQQSMARIKDTLIDLGGVVLPLVADALEPVADFIAGLAERFRELDPGVQTAIVAIGAVAAAIGPVLVIIGQVVSALSSLSGFFGATGASALRFLGPIGLIASILITAYQNSQPLRDALADLGTQFIEIGQQLLTSLQPAFDAIAGVLPILGDLFAQIATVVGDVLAAVLPLVGELVGSLVPVIAELVSTILPPLVEIFGAIVEAIIPVVEVLADILIPVIEELLPIVQTVFGAVVDIISAAVDVIASVLEVFSSDSLNDWGAFWDAILGVVKAVGGLLLTALRGVFDSILSIFGTDLNGLKDLWNRIWNGIVSFFRNTGVNIVNAASNIGRNLANTFGKAVGNVRNIWDTGLNRIRDVITRAFNGFVRAAAQGIGNVVSTIRDLPRRFREVLSNLFSIGNNAGASIMRGLTSGITSGISNAVGALSSGLSRLRSYLPFSPAKAGPFSGRGWSGFSGEAIIKDLAEGMVRAENQAIRDASRVIGSIQGATQIDVPSTPTTVGVQRASVAPVQINQNFLGPTTSGGRLSELNWTVRYATQARQETIEGVAV